MPKFQVAQDNALILQLPSKKETKISNNKMSCFLDNIDFLLPDPSTKPLLETSAIRNELTEVELLAKEFNLCAFIFNQLATSPDASHEQNETAKVTDKTLKNWLIKNLKNNYARFKNASLEKDVPSLSDSSINEYVNSFLQYWGTEQGENYQLSLQEWLEKAAAFSDINTALTLGNTARKFLKQESFSDDFKAMSTQNKAGISFMLLLDKIAQDYGFKTDASWNPTQPIDNLLAVIKTRGFLIVGGYFGRDQYSSEPNSKVIQNLEVHYWKKNDFKKKSGQIHHSIIIIGASKKGYDNQTQDLVFFVDPSNDDKIYIRSYLSFCQRIGPTNGILTIDEIDQTASYFYYHPSLKPTLALSEDKNTINENSFWNSCKKVTAVGLTIAAATTAVVYGVFKS